ncbi:hypothetical protein P3T27_007521 [Kitasatospora sp. MAA19]|nr:hypothetical protein [Kitasatospora sp. MAA19]
MCRSVLTVGGSVRCAVRVLVRPATVVAAAVLVTGLSAPTVYAQTRGIHRGVDGCIAWSYDPGWATTTVYVHNRCDEARVAKIAWKWTGLEVTTVRLASDAKTSVNRRSDPDTIWDAGRA